MSSHESQLLSDLGAVLEDFNGIGYVPQEHSGVHAWAPRTIDRLDLMIDGAHGLHHGSRHFRSVNRLLRLFRELIARHVNLVNERQRFNAHSNVVVSVPFDNVAAASTSAVATVGAPYSGVAFMLCAILCPSPLQPRGRLTNLTFAGINFATPSIDPTVVTYGVGTGVPTTQGMGYTSFYENLTMPNGYRTFEAWTDWVFDPSARFSVAVFNPDTVFARSYDFDFMMRSSPCSTQYDADMAYHRGWYGDEFQHVIDQIHGAVVGLGSGQNFQAIRHGLVRQTPMNRPGLANIR